MVRQVETWVREVLRFRFHDILKCAEDDIVQEVIMGVWREVSRERFALRSGLRALVRTIATRRCIDALRRLRPMLEVPENLAADGREPVAVLEEEELRARLRQAMFSLGLSCQRVIRDHYFAGQTYGEIAAREGLTAGAIGFRMFECMKKLRRLMGA